MKRFVVLISGQGRNLQALIEACADGRIPGRIAAVVSNRPQAYGLERARQAGIPAITLPHTDYSSREAYDAALADVVAGYAPDAVVLAGYMRILTPAFITPFADRLLNIHPSLLPRHPGLRTHEAVIAAGDAEHGATVHFVTEALDGGPAIIQGRFKRRPEDTAEVLAERVMQEVELKIYPQAVAWMLAGDLALREGRACFRGRALAQPLAQDALEEPFR